jgi:hypothetical protein
VALGNAVADATAVFTMFTCAVSVTARPTGGMLDEVVRVFGTAV